MRANLSCLPTGNIADNNPSPHQGVMDSGIKPLDPCSHMVGRAVTIQAVPGDNLALHQAIYAAEPGDVLVIDCQGYTGAGHFGDIMATACMVRGIAGVVLDGSCRDSEDIKKLGFPMFVRGVNPSGTVKETLAKINVPVLVGGIMVQPGDLVIGDCDGVVVIPQSLEDSVIGKAIEKHNKELEIVKKLEAGQTTLEIYGFDKLIAQKQK
ncbi:MAG: RraA family protein [Oscillospiraceae bacterium]|nr:RraA family protein [Oscillospiraceae bacterium]